MSTKKDDEQRKYEAIMREIAFISEQTKQVDLIFAKTFPSMLSIEPVKNVEALQIQAHKKSSQNRNKGQRQMDEIIAELKRLGHNPLCLPALVAGKSSAKAEARDKLNGKGLFTAPTAFENMWEELTKRKMIKYRKVDALGLRT
jgi:hypothetical protein